MNDTRTAKLEWIRDGLKWVVGIASGLLTLSATYFYDRFNQAPDYRVILYIAWSCLITSSLSGILATLATWKNLGNAGDFGPYLKGLYATSMWSFTIGFAALAFVLVANVGTSHEPNPGEVVGLFAVPDSLPAFAPASASLSDPRFATATCSIRRRLADSGSFAALVVGRADGRELSHQAHSRFATNLELAKNRADRIAALLTDSSACAALPLRHVITITSGSRHLVPHGFEGSWADDLLAADRHVEVYGFEVRVRPAKR